MAGSRLVPAAALERFAGDIFIAAGLTPAHAATVAEVLVWADLRGHDPHGVQRIPDYVEMVEQGALNLAPKMTRHAETAASLILDADHAAGPVALSLGTREAMARAKTAGVGLVVVRRATHTGAIGYYTALAAAEGMAAIAFAASVPNMIYHGARQAGVATSPLSIAVPGGADGPLLLDMATSVVSRGKLVQARKSGRALEPGWAVDAAGEPTTDAEAASLPLPLGGPKGAGLALMFECLASLLGGSPILADILAGTLQGPRRRQNATVIAIDIARFGDVALFRDNVARLATGIKALPRQAGVDEILMPGERGARSMAARRRDGIPVPPATWRDLARVAAQCGVAMPA